MQVTCPNCRARYAVDPLAIGPSGRTVQCARCNDRWFQTVKLEPSAAAEVVAAHPAAAPPSPEEAKPVSPFSAEAMAESDLGPLREPTIPARPSFGAGQRSSSDRAFIDTMPIPDMVIRPTMKGAGLPALIEPKADRRLGLILLAILILLGVAGAALYIFRQDILPLLPAEWRIMLRLG